jgi:uncharacterized membrane protein
MIGFAIGLACLWGLFRVIRGGRGWHHGRRHGCHGGYRGRYGWLRGAFERLDTSPGQEKEVRQAVDQVLDAAHELKREINGTREDLGRVMRSELFDSTLLDQAFERHDAAFAKMRAELTASIEKIHGALDAQQREELARWLERGPRWGRSWGGPYRSHA